MNTAQNPPVGPEIDTTPRPLPARVKLRGAHVELEPMHRRHVPELWQAMNDPRAEASWAYLGYGPFADETALTRFIGDFSTTHDPIAWVVRPIASGVASGWLTLMEIQPRNAAIELGNIWFAPAMQRTRAATEAMVMLLRLAADDLGYRRLVWKCNALNAPSKRAADRLGFTYEGRHRAHLTVKGRQRETDWYSIIAPEWPRTRDAMLAWLAPENFSPDGTAHRSMAAIRAASE